MHVFFTFMRFDAVKLPSFLFGLWVLLLKICKFDSSDVIIVFCFLHHFASGEGGGGKNQSRVSFEIVTSMAGGASSVPVLNEAELPPLHVVFRGLVEAVASSHCQRSGVAGAAGVPQLTATHVAFGEFKHKIQALIPTLIKPRVAIFAFMCSTGSGGGAGCGGNYNDYRVPPFG